MGGSFVLTHSQHTVQCASKYNLELKETEIFLKMIPLLISINIIPSEEKCSPTASSSRATSEEEGNWRGCEGLKVSKSILLISQARRRKEMGALGYIQPSITLKQALVEATPVSRCKIENHHKGAMPGSYITLQDHNSNSNDMLCATEFARIGTPLLSSYNSQF